MKSGDLGEAKKMNPVRLIGLTFRFDNGWQDTISVFHQRENRPAGSGRRSIPGFDRRQIDPLFTPGQIVAFHLTIQPFSNHVGAMIFILLEQVGQSFRQLPEPDRVIRMFSSV